MLREPLMKLAIEYFRRRGYRIERPGQKGSSSTSESSKIDFIVVKQNEMHPVLVKEWNRTVGVNVVINFDKASQDKRFSNPILISEKFSEHAKAYANRRGIKLITRLEIMRSLA